MYTVRILLLLSTALLFRPRLIAIGTIVVVAGYFLAALPHFFMKNYNYKQLTTRVNNTEEDILCR